MIHNIRKETMRAVIVWHTQSQNLTPFYDMYKWHKHKTPTYLYSLKKHTKSKLQSTDPRNQGCMVAQKCSKEKTIFGPIRADSESIFDQAWSWQSKSKQLHVVIFFSWSDNLSMSGRLKNQAIPGYFSAAIRPRSLTSTEVQNEGKTNWSMTFRLECMQQRQNFHHHRFSAVHWLFYIKFHSMS